MKQIKVLVLVCLPFLVSGLFSQETLPNKPKSGILVFGGPTFSNESATPGLKQAQSKAFRFGFQAGIGCELPFNDRLAFQFRFVYATGGAVYQYHGYTITWKENSLEIPVLVKYRFTTGSGPFVLAGIYVGSILSPTTTLNDPATGVTEEESIPEDEINKFVYGLVFGGGYEHGFSPLTVFVEATYKLGLSNIQKSELRGALRLSAINLTAGIKF
jgi:hypothetical protein